MQESIIQDDEGKILGRVNWKKERGRNLSIKEVGIIKQFLINLKQEKHMSSTTEKVAVNLVKLAGTVKKLYTDDQKKGSAFIDTETEGSNWVTCTIFESAELMDKLKTFKEGDYIQIVGHVRSWSKKVNDSYQRGTEVRITSIANQGTAKAKPRVQSDEVPF